jgi:hypothetical protein
MIRRHFAGGPVRTGNTSYRARMERCADLAAERGMWVIFDLFSYDLGSASDIRSQQGHNWDPNDPAGRWGDANWNAIWTNMGTWFKDNGNVALELGNEPDDYDNTGWTSAMYERQRARYAATIALLRGLGFTNPIVIPGTGFGTTLSNWPSRAASLNDTNIMFDIHRYWWWQVRTSADPNATSVSDVRSALNARGCDDLLNAGYRVLVGEFGVHGGESSQDSRGRTWFQSMLRVQESDGYDTCFQSFQPGNDFPGIQGNWNDTNWPSRVPTTSFRYFYEGWGTTYGGVPDGLQYYGGTIQGQYTVTLLAGQGGSTVPGAGTYTKFTDDAFTATAQAANNTYYEFSHWLRDGVIYSTNATVSFIGVEGTTYVLQPVFTQAEAAWTETCDTWDDSKWTYYYNQPTVVGDGTWKFPIPAGWSGNVQAVHRAITGYGTYTVTMKIDGSRRPLTGLNWYSMFLFSESLNEVDSPESLMWGNATTYTTSIAIHPYDPQGNYKINPNEPDGKWYWIFEATEDVEDGNWHTWKTEFTSTELKLYIDDVLQKTITNGSDAEWNVTNIDFWPTVTDMQLMIGAGFDGSQTSQWDMYVSEITYTPSVVIPPLDDEYTVTVLSGMGGFTAPGAGTYTYYLSQLFTITAYAAADYTFSHWLRNGGNVSANTTLSFTGAKDAVYTVQPVFTYTPGTPDVPVPDWRRPNPYVPDPGDPNIEPVSGPRIPSILPDPALPVSDGSLFALMLQRLLHATSMTLEDAVSSLATTTPPRLASLLSNLERARVEYD